MPDIFTRAGVRVAADTDPLATWTRRGVRVHAKALRPWRAELHPRDRRGRFIEVGGRVRILGGGTGTVLGVRDRGRVEIRRDSDGRAVLVDNGYLTVLARADGSPPTADRAAVQDAEDPPPPPAPEMPEAAHLVTDTPEDAPGAGSLTEPTEAQQVAAKQKWKLPTGDLTDLQAQLAGLTHKPVPSVLDLIDAGELTPAQAVAEHKRQARNAGVDLWRRRTKLQAAIDGIKATDGKADPGGLVKAAQAEDPTLDPQQVAADPTGEPKILTPAAIDATLYFGDEPLALYEAGPGAQGPGGVGGIAGREWFDALRLAPDSFEGKTIPVLGVTVQGHRVEAGWAARRDGRAYLVESKPGETPAAALGRLEAAAATVEGVLKHAPEDKRGFQRGVALINGDNPQDGHWAQKYKMPGFHSAATGGDGSTTFWRGNPPDPATVAHEFGHNIDGGGYLNLSWLSDADTPVLINQPMSWKAAAAADGASSSFHAAPGRYVETRKNPKAHPVTPGHPSGTTAYGATDNREDFAESTRLWLKDRREGKIGYDPAAGDDLRFSDLFPERARVLDVVFGTTTDFATPARQRRRAEAEQLYYESYKSPQGGPPPDAAAATGLPAHELAAAGTRAADRLAQEKQDAASAANKKAQAAAKADADAATAAQAAAQALAAAQVATIKAALDAGLVDKPAADKLRARKRAFKFHAKEKGASDAQASAAADAWEAALLAKMFPSQDGPQPQDATPTESATAQTALAAAQAEVTAAGSGLSAATLADLQTVLFDSYDIQMGDLAAGGDDVPDPEDMAEGFAEGLAYQYGWDDEQTQARTPLVAALLKLKVATDAAAEDDPGDGQDDDAGGPQTLSSATAAAPPEPWKGKEMAPGIKPKLRLAAQKWVAAAGGAPHPLAKNQEGKSQQAKANIGAQLGSRLNNEADWAVFRAYRAAQAAAPVTSGNPPPAVGAFGDYTPAQRQALLDTEASTRVHHWASTSGDTSDPAILMQEAAKQEFGLTGHSAPRASQAEYEKLMAERWAAYGPFYRIFVRRMYENTQAEFAAAGITHVSVFRGMNFHSGKPPWAQAGQHRPQLQPINSWSTSRVIGKRFTSGGGANSVVFEATVPVELVLGSARTGFGCLNEKELVILDADGLADATPAVKESA